LRYVILGGYEPLFGIRMMKYWYLPVSVR